MKIFVNPSGQRENLGDSVLRRAYLDALRTKGQLHVYVGEHESYVAGLGLRAADIRYPSKVSWLAAALRGGITSRSIFALNAGEIVTGWNYVSTAIWQSAIMLSQRVGRGQAVALGIAVRPQPTQTRGLLGRILRRAKLVAWRDPESREKFQVGSVAPDWAFALGSNTDSIVGDFSGREYVAVSMRGDRPYPPPIWFEAVRAIAADRKCRILVVEQVEHDRKRCEEIASELGAELLTWDDPSHSVHEARVREAYAKSLCVVSDRIHALIIGMTEGAVPLGFTSSNPEKIVRTFAPVTDAPVGMEVGRVVELDDLLAHADGLIINRPGILTDLGNSRRALAQLAEELASV